MLIGVELGGLQRESLGSGVVEGGSWAPVERYYQNTSAICHYMFCLLRS